MRSVLVSASKIASYINVYNIYHSFFFQRLRLRLAAAVKRCRVACELPRQAALKRASYLVSTGAHYVKA